MEVLCVYVLATMVNCLGAYCLPLKFMIKDDPRRGVAEEIQRGDECMTL